MMWIEKGDIVTAIRSGQLVSGRVIRNVVNCPRCVVRFLDPDGGYRFISEQWHYDDLRLATELEIKKFNEDALEARKKDEQARWGKNAASRIG